MELFKFHFEIPGKDSKDLQLLNKSVILLRLLVFNIEISGNDFNDLQLQNNSFNS